MTFTLWQTAILLLIGVIGAWIMGYQTARAITEKRDREMSD